MEKARRDVVQALDRLDIVGEQARQWQIDFLGLGQRDRIVEGAQPIDILGRQRHRLTVPEVAPLLLGEGAIGVEGGAALGHYGWVPRAAFSARPDWAVRASSSAITSESGTPAALSTTIR